MNAKYYLRFSEHGRTGWYPVDVPDPPPPSLRIPLIRMAAEYIERTSVVEDRPVPERTDITLTLAYIEEWVTGYCVAVYL